MDRDWHIHSDYSDSSRSIYEIVKIANQLELKSIAITDHDTIKNISEAQSYSNNQCKVIPGIEISAWDPVIKKEIHVLGYYFNAEAENIKIICESTTRQREENARQQIKILRSLGYDISVEEVSEKKRNSPCTYKQHIFAVLIEKGYCKEFYGSLYQCLFKKGGLCQLKINLPHIQDVIESIHEDGGFAIVAHPELSGCIEECIRYGEYGIDGIESYHSSQSKNARKRCNELAQQFQWIETGGSDNHGEYGKEAEIGPYF